RRHTRFSRDWSSDVCSSDLLVIEHNLDVIKTADYIIDLGPEGGDAGGTVVAEGTPEEIVRVKAPHTGRFLEPILKRDRERMEQKSEERRAGKQSSARTVSGR